MLRILLIFLILPAAALGTTPIETIPGYWAHPYYEGLTAPTSLCFDQHGNLYVGGLDSRVHVLRDLNGDGIADTSIVVVSGLSFPLGLAVNAEDKLYVSSRDLLSCPVDTNMDFVADYIDTVFTGFPIGPHQNSGIAFGPYGNLFVTSGSISNNGEQPALAACILRLTPEGKLIDVFASGLRNPYDLAFVNGVLYAPDNSVSGDTTFTCWEAPDEVNRIIYGGDYGFPGCFGIGNCADLEEYCIDPCGVGDCERGEGCAGTVAPYVFLDPHSAPAGICSAKNFPGFGDDDMFLALWGQQDPVQDCSTNFGHKLIWFNTSAPSGTPPFDFATGFESPIDVIVGPDNALYVADFTVGTIYRIIKTSATGVPADPPAPLKVRAAPNPASHGITLRWGAPTTTPAQVNIFDVAGRRVADFRDVYPGQVWNLEDEQGNRVAQGVYWIHVTAGAQAGSKKVLVLQ